MVTAIIIPLLWGIISTLIFMEYIQICKELNSVDKFIVILIFIIGGPIFALNNILTAFLDCIFPEGWDDNDRKY